jgi:hypothetical protein
MGLLLSLMRRHLCCHQPGIVTLVMMVLLSLMQRHLCSLGIFAIVMITLLPLLQWHCCCDQAGVVALVMMALLPSSVHRHLCCCHDGVVALIGLVPLPTLHGRCCTCCTSIVIFIVLTLLPSCCMGDVTIVAPALLPPSSWRVCAVELVSLPLSGWCCCP